MNSIGRKVLKDSKMEDLLNHNYLRKSLEQRVQRKALYNEYLSSLKLDIA